MRRLLASIVVILVFAVAAIPASVSAASALDPAGESPAGSWAWPGGIDEIVSPYEQPAHEYAPGHRGIDVAVAGSDVVSPADGVVAFVGGVAGRPLLTIEHRGGLVSTLEPVDSELSAGDSVTRGSVVGTLATGGHTPPGAVHLGARLDGEYIDPTALLGAAERPVLLPCC
ncbi:murein hydrolase activator EnvC [Microbacterium sp. G2-8]|uniref:murein hydrolase activator EnvC family protein n=1 Tax=Microbacterium sp. G2-8 TaxID=2842454 RepID=UPI001C8AEF5E|nr:M23 family metallopeptidase [Microbacterium sp. G2-8]